MIPGITASGIRAAQGSGNDPHWASVIALLSFDNLSDASVNKSADTWVSTGLTPAVEYAKFGSGGVNIGGVSGRYLRSAATYNFGTGDFTFEGSALTTAGSPVSAIFQIVTPAGRFSMYRLIGSTASVAVWKNISGTLGAPGNVPMRATGVWYHIAFVRKEGVVRAYVDGKVALESAGFALPLDGATVYIGNNGTSEPWIGRLDEIRITKGVARYWDEFSPPTVAPFPVG